MKVEVENLFSDGTYQMLLVPYTATYRSGGVNER